jgi:hypothetical protein
MKVFHIFPNSVFCNDYIEKINLLFTNQEHHFYIYGHGNFSNDKKYNNITIRTHIEKKLELYKFIIFNFIKADKIILHSLFLDNDLMILITVLQRIVGKKYCWWIWGGDLYNSYWEALNLNKLSIEYIKGEFIRKILIKELHHISATNIEDYRLTKKWYNTKAKYNYSFYPIKLYKLPNVNVDRKCINILIGNSATKENRHIDALNILSFLKNNENVRIYCPLSYPEDARSYIYTVKKYGTKLFGDRFIAITNFLPYDKYMDLLNSIDIAIFNNNRQQAGGNIASLIYMGKKVYINSLNPFYNYWKRKKAKVFKFNKLNQNEFTQLLDELSKEKNSEIVADALSDSNFRDSCGKIFRK